VPALIVSQPSTGQVCGPAVFTVMEPTFDWLTSAVSSGDAFTSLQVRPETPITTTFAIRLAGCAAAVLAVAISAAAVRKRVRTRRRRTPIDLIRRRRRPSAPR
jgi:hypothetical protein